MQDRVATLAGVIAAGKAGKGQPVVLAHGWPWSSYCWHRIIPSLAEDYHVHWYDMPGYGQSEMSEGQRTSLDVQGETFTAMLAHWKLNRPIVIAHDMGGAVTLRAHLLHGIDYDRYVLMNVVAMRPWGSKFFDHVKRHIDAFVGLPPHIHEAVVRAYIKGALVRDLPADDFEELVRPWLSSIGQASFYSQFGQADERYTAEIEPMFGTVRCPLTIFWGENDPWIPLERGRHLRERMPQARFTTFPRVGHLPQLERPAVVLRALKSFLRT